MHSPKQSATEYKQSYGYETSRGGESVTLMLPNSLMNCRRPQPTKSHYSYNRLVDEKDIARFGPISPARVRHAGPTGDTADYDSADVEAMALRLASAAVRRR